MVRLIEIRNSKIDTNTRFRQVRSKVTPYDLYVVYSINRYANIHVRASPRVFLNFTL
jgi:hypothetical protein